jgi:hypothetical protein
MDPTDLLPGTTLAVDPTSAFPIAGSTGAASGVGAGQQGIVPLVPTGGSLTDGINDVWDWLNTPFTEPMSPWDLLLMVGIVLFGIIFWNLILYHIRIAAETI